MLKIVYKSLNLEIISRTSSLCSVAIAIETVSPSAASGRWWDQHNLTAAVWPNGEGIGFRGRGLQVRVLSRSTFFANKKIIEIF